MQLPVIYTHNPKHSINDFAIFILCKGLNSGKPLDQPCPNSFVMQCHNQAEKDFYYALAFGIWKAKHLQQYIKGSVIPYIRIGDFKEVIKCQAEAVKANFEAFEMDVKKIILIEQREKLIQSQLVLLAEVKRMIIYQHLKR